MLAEVREACRGCSCFITGAYGDVDGGSRALGIRKVGVGEAGAAGEMVGGVGGGHELR